MYLQDEITNTLVIERSRFICYMKHVRSEEEYREYLNEIRKKHYDATHVCSALICHNIQRSSDDNEPSGTAGSPILNVLQKNGLDETCALVVRYFGGIKLGAGGLIRAYGNSVSRCLEKAVFVEDVEYDRYELVLDYETANKIDHFLRNHTNLLDIAYDVDVTYTFAVNDEEALKKISEYTKGRKASYIGKQIIPTVVK
ncbi:MAG: YigZ family protein [Erysipelotrichaceae bacterium]|nr:YigZ family protein [Erysipelotrichaceae bacterium]